MSTMIEDIMFWMDILRELLSKRKSCKYHSDFTVKSSIRLNTNEVYEFVLVAEIINTGFVYDIFVNLDNDTKLLFFEHVDGLKCNFKVHIVPSRLTRTVNDVNLLISCNKANQALFKKVKALEEHNKQLESKLEIIIGIVMTTTFETAKVGDKVYSPTFGWGEIICIDGFEHYPIEVRFQNVAIDTYYFTLEGYYYEDVPIQSLFWDEVVIKAPIKPVKLTTAKIVNGMEIPNISFNPNPGEYCYSPVPTHPDLYKHLYYCYNETNEHLRNNGLCYPYTEEGKAAAILHAKAMLKTN